MPEDVRSTLRSHLPLRIVKPLLIVAADDDSLGVEAYALSMLGGRLYPRDPEILVVSAHITWSNVELEKFDADAAALLSLVDSGQLVGAAGVMLDRLSTSQGHGSDMRSLELSIEAEPDWVDNHWQLASALRDLGDVEASLRELSIAQANCRDLAQCAEVSAVELAWAHLFTGKFADPDQLGRLLGL
jgi:hypothetical protein